MDIEIKKTKPFKYVDYLHFENDRGKGIDIAPAITTLYNDRAVNFSVDTIYVHGVERSAEAFEVFNSELKEVQLCMENGSELRITGSEIRDYIGDKIMLSQDGIYYEMNLKGREEEMER